MAIRVPGEFHEAKQLALMLHLSLREKSLNNTLDMKPSESVGDLQGREIAIELYGSYFF